MGWGTIEKRWETLKEILVQGSKTMGEGCLALEERYEALQE